MITENIETQLQISRIEERNNQQERRQTGPKPTSMLLDEKCRRTEIIEIHNPKSFGENEAISTNKMNDDSEKCEHTNECAAENALDENIKR
jgi:hypothetical protein